MSRLVLEWTEQERRDLADLRDHANKPYLRERAAALLNVAAKVSAAEVARTGLLKLRQPRTVEHWVQRFQKQGLAGLVTKSGGRKGPPPGRAGAGGAGP